MSNNFLLDWSSLAVSLFNALLLLWLGLTVLFNAEHRTWGVLLAGIGLLSGASFFFAHSIILSLGASALVRGLNFWWHIGWAPVIASPYAWYILMLWYTGFFDDRRSGLHRRHLPWLTLCVFLTVLLAVLLFNNPLPEFTLNSAGDYERSYPLFGAPLLILIYPPYIVLCIGLSLDALLHPAPSSRLMGDLARRRARPWLIGASLVLLLVSLLTGLVLFWLIENALHGPILPDLIYALASPLSWLDLLLASLLLVAILLLGQAVVSYEIFTGKTLPRRGFLNQWRNVLLLSAFLSIATSFCLTAEVPPVYALLGLLGLFGFFYAMFNWRGYREREADMHQLRPFISSQRLFDNILAPSPAEIDLQEPFNALCRDVLGARQADLVPLGWLAALSGTPLHFPPGSPAHPLPLEDLVARCNSPQIPGIPLDPSLNSGVAWALPLWGMRGLVGLLLLGEKSDGGFYSLEEIEIARTSGERLADTTASAEMARRLVTLTRQRLAESQVIDRQARRALHDDVLPRLHTALLTLSSLTSVNSSERQEALEQLAQVHRQIADLLHALPPAAAPDVARYGLIPALKMVVEQELSGAFDRVEWQVDPLVESRLTALAPLSVEVLFYAAREVMRNAAQHARPAVDLRPLNLRVNIDWKDGLWVCLEDDGLGIHPQSSSHGSGQGLALHSTMLAIIGGSLALESIPGKFTRVTLILPQANEFSSN